LPHPRRPARRTTLALAFGFATAASSSAYAEDATSTGDDSSPPRQEDDDPPLELPGWAVIFGAGASPLLGGAGDAGAIGGLAGSWAPIVFGGFEARLLPTLWLIGRAQGSVEQSRYDDSFGDHTNTLWALGGDLGIRHVLTDPEPLELSWVLVVRGHYGESHVPDGSVEASGWDAGGQLGLVLQHHFTSWLALRARVDLLEAGYQRSRYVQAAPPQAADQDNWYARLTAKPSIAMRFGF